jgi:hypothetical protein
MVPAYLVPTKFKIVLAESEMVSVESRMVPMKSGSVSE